MREGNKVIREDSKENEEMDSTLSYINPFSNSEDLCNQVLQLAKNVSRFEQTPEEPVENGYLKKAKKNQHSVEKGSFSKASLEKEGMSRWKKQKMEP